MKRNIFSFNRSGFLKMAALGLLSLNTMLAFGQCNAVNQLEVPSTFANPGMDGGGNFNAFVFGNYYTGDGGGTAGRLAVGGDFTYNSTTGGTYQVGVGDVSIVTSDNMIVQGMLTNSAGTVRVRGNANYSSLEGLSAAPVHNAGEGSNSVTGGLFNYPNLKSYYTTLSDTKKNTAAVPGTVVIGTVNVAAGAVTLTGNGSPAQYVFNVTLVGGQLTDIVYVNIPVGSEILINILNTIVSIAPTTGSVAMTDVHRPKTLFNFPNATQILLSSFTLEGGILAPLADLSAQNAVVRGSSVIGGNILLANNFSFETGCLPTPLPVSLSAFAAVREGAGVNLAWETTSEVTSDKFVVEQSAKGKTWSALGEVSSKGERLGKTSYSFFHSTPAPGSNLYRLKMVDTDGTFAYSRMISLNIDYATSVETYPNPVSETLSIRQDGSFNIKAVNILDQTGKAVFSKIFDGKDIDVRNLPAGLYVVKLLADSGAISAHKIIKK